MSASKRPQNGRSAGPLVLVHGDFGDGFESWGPACALIGRRSRTVVLDRPGYGADLLEDTRFSITDEACALLDILDEMGAPSFHLVGHSYGGLIAIEMARTRPDAIRSLHLIEPPLLDLLPEEPLVREIGQRAQWILEHHAEIGDEAATEAFFSMIGAERAVERLRGTPEWDRLCGHATRFARGEPASAYPSSSLAGLPAGTPVTIYSGERSHPALRLVTRELVNRIDGARLVDVPEAGHAVQMGKDRFVDPLLDLVQAADLAWEPRNSVARPDADGEERTLG